MAMNFWQDETGAVTADWVAMTAALVGLGVSATAAVRTSTYELSDNVGSALTGARINPLRWLASNDRVLQNFANGNTSGWSRGQTTAFGAWGTMLGPFGNETRTAPLTHTFTLSPGATNAMVEFDLIIGDSWDGAAGPNNPWTRPEGDVIRFQVNGQTISTEPFVQNANHMGFRPGMLSERTSTVVIGQTTYNLRLTPTNLPTANIGGGTTPDQRWRVQLEAVNAPQNLQLGYSAITSNNASNESFGITNFVIREN
jgi:hypothetical protein